MKIVTFNINGIRSVIKKGILSWIKKYNPEVLCFQETRISYDKINKKLFQNLGYYNYWNCGKKKGYSGVCILTKTIPNQIIYKTNIEIIDQEGRCIVVLFDKYAIINIYIPSGSDIKKRLKFKLLFMKKLKKYIIFFLKNISKNIIICGDYNICHKNIDIHNYKINKNNSGCLDIEKKWLDNIIKLGFIDTFRHLNKTSQEFTWWSYKYKSKIKNKGWRIDYHLISDKLKSCMYKSTILNNINYSDHAPVVLQIKI